MLKRNSRALILFDSIHVHCFLTYCYINQIEKSGFVFWQSLSVWNWLSEVGFSRSLMLLLQPWLLASKTRARNMFWVSWYQTLNQLRQHISLLVLFREKKCKSNLSSSSINCPTLSAALCWLFPEYSLFLPFLNSTLHKAISDLTSISLWFFK